MMRRFFLLGAMVMTVPAAAQVASPAAAQASAPNVRAGVDLWRAGDWAGAVAIWRPFADQGDADAMFNIGQAYKLGRAVPIDKVVARDWYRKAALKNHLPAQANLGILLFQAGEKPEAARWLKTAADRGEMRAQYVLGVAHWNGEGVAKNLALAHAYLSRASAQGLSEATVALANLNRTISPADRGNGTTIAASLAAGAGIPAVNTPSAALSAAELNRRNLEAVQRPAASPQAIAPAPPQASVARQVPATPVPAAPAPAPAATVTPASATQVAAATPASGPAVARSSAPPPSTPASIPLPSVAPSAPQVRPVDVPAAAAPTSRAPKAPEAVAAVPAPKPEAGPRPAGRPKVPELPAGWRVQLGAFGKQAQAEAAWADVKAKQKAAVGTAKPIYDPGTSIIKLQMGPYKTRDAANDACAKLAFSGRACFVVAG